jgi:hypothetical protein
MAQVTIGSYLENNQTAATSKTVSAGDTFVGDIAGGCSTTSAGAQNADVYKARSAGVFCGIDGHKA